MLNLILRIFLFSHPCTTYIIPQGTVAWDGFPDHSISEEEWGAKCNWIRYVVCFIHLGCKRSTSSTFAVPLGSYRYPRFFPWHCPFSERWLFSCTYSNRLTWHRLPPWGSPWVPPLSPALPGPAGRNPIPVCPPRGPEHQPNILSTQALWLLFNISW
jgi:hypothetical protein